MNKSNHSSLLVRAADKASQRPEYLGWVFRQYAELEKKTETDMAGALGVSRLDYQRLRLCLRPRPEKFSADAQQIAAKFAANVAELARIVRHLEALVAMRDEPAATTLPEAGWMMAARARGKGKHSKRKGRKDGNRKRP
jgi:hypothetical protein